MATYKCLADLQGKILNYKDTVILKDITYSVETRFLAEPNDDNSKIFKVLSISNKEKFATIAYGYESQGGEWPECRRNDYMALTRCVIALYKIIEETTSKTTKQKQLYKITTPGISRISPEQVKTLITKYGGLIDPTLNYKSSLGVYVWSENEEVICLPESDIKEKKRCYRSISNNRNNKN